MSKKKTRKTVLDKVIPYQSLSLALRMRPKLWRASGREVTAHRPEVLDFGGLYTHVTRRDCTGNRLRGQAELIRAQWPVRIR